MSTNGGRHRLSDFTTDPRVLVIAGIAIVVATAGVAAGVILLKLIRLATNLAYFGQLQPGRPQARRIHPSGCGRC